MLSSWLKFFAIVGVSHLLAALIIGFPIYQGTLNPSGFAWHWHPVAAFLGWLIGVLILAELMAMPFLANLPAPNRGPDWWYRHLLLWPIANWLRERARGY